jgi:hypothetical protein
VAELQTLQARIRDAVRNGEPTRNRGLTKTAVNNLIQKNGVWGRCPFTRLTYFDPTRDVVVDLMHTIGGNVKRTMDLFRGNRVLTLTNKARSALGLDLTGKAQRSEVKEPSRAAKKPKQRETAELHHYLAVTGERRTSVVGLQYKVLWADGSLTWEPASEFTKSVYASEGLTSNVITKYEQQRAPSQRKRHAQQAETYAYRDVLNHKDVQGKRSQYEVWWEDGTTSWEPVTQFLRDATRAEGSDNVVSRYEARKKRERAQDFASWVEKLNDFVVSETEQIEADSVFTNIPVVPSLLPWSVRAPLTGAAGRMKMHDYILWCERWAGFHLRGRFDHENRRLLVAYYRYMGRLVSRKITARDIAALKTERGVLAELELALPPTEFTILVHVLVHVPEQLEWFGPAPTTWMFLYERSHPQESNKPLIKS